MAVNYFKHTITDGIVHHDDQPLLEKYVVTYGDRATSVRLNGKKQGGLHDIRLADGRRVRANMMRQKQLEKHREKSLIKVRNSNGIVRYYQLISGRTSAPVEKNNATGPTKTHTNTGILSRLRNSLATAPTPVRVSKSKRAGVSRVAFDTAKRKWGGYSSWAVWASARPGMPTKDGMGDVSVLDPDANPALLSTLSPNIVLLGLNAANRPVNPVPWGNFHDDYRYSQDYKIRHALQGTPLWGAYMTDLFVGLHQTDSSEVTKWARENTIEVKRHMRRLEEELKDIGADRPLLIAFGGTSYRLAKQFLGDKYVIERLTHYSAAVSPDALRQEVINIVEKHDL